LTIGFDQVKTKSGAIPGMDAGSPFLSIYYNISPTRRCRHISISCAALSSSR
jgi:hypothetical protein